MPSDICIASNGSGFSPPMSLSKTMASVAPRLTVRTSTTPGTARPSTAISSCFCSGAIARRTLAALRPSGSRSLPWPGSCGSRRRSVEIAQDFIADKNDAIGCSSGVPARIGSTRCCESTCGMAPWRRRTESAVRDLKQPFRRCRPKPRTKLRRPPRTGPLPCPLDGPRTDIARQLRGR